MPVRLAQHVGDGSLGGGKDVANDIAASVIAMRFVVGRIERCLIGKSLRGPEF